MFPYIFVFGFLLLIMIILAGRWYVGADSRSIINFFKWIFFIGVGSLALFFLITGKLGWVFMGLPLFIPIIMRLRALKRAYKTFSRMTGVGGNKKFDQVSEVETDTLRIALNQETGEIKGEVLKGPLKGRHIEDLSHCNLLELLDYCRVKDSQTAQILEAYLDRIDKNWREKDKGAEQFTNTDKNRPMDRSEALKVLGLSEGATELDIKDAYYNLIRNLHPDRGGSDYLAAKINQAKDLLLGK